MRPIRVLLALVTSVALTGCINSTTLVKLKTDGSGTIEQTTLVNVAAMKSMMPGMQQSGQAPNVVNRADLERTELREIANRGDLHFGLEIVIEDDERGIASRR